MEGTKGKSISAGNRESHVAVPRREISSGSKTKNIAAVIEESRSPSANSKKNQYDSKIRGSWLNHQCSVEWSVHSA